ncbi:MAG: RDD family protein, partial [Myxococcales bacterium]|nr:RDD family protein [Myxococcales bacterium]
DDALVSVPVHGAPRGPVGPAETVAAPGELAGLISDLESRINARPPAPPVRDPKPLTERPAARTPERGVLPQPPPSASAVRKGLTSHLPVTPDPNEPSLVRPVPLTATDAELDEVDEDVDLDLGLDLREPPPLEETRAFLDVRLDQALSMPGEALSAARPMARNDTGPMPAMLPPQYLVGATEVESENRLEVASHVRRVLGALLDAALVFGLLTVPVLLELFGADVARASPIDPDDVTRLAMQGSLTLPAVAGAALVLLYVTLTSALGRSLGKLAFGLRLVCNDTGERPGFGRALVRGAAALLFGVMLGLGPLWILVSRNARALHDVIAGTTVVRS